MASRRGPLVVGLACCQLFDAGFNAVGLYGIAQSTRLGKWTTEWTKDDLDRLGFPASVRFVFPIIKATSAAGLLMGLRSPRLGRWTATALVAYFAAALAYHHRAQDSIIRRAPAAFMLVWSAMASAPWPHPRLRVNGSGLLRD